MIACLSLMPLQELDLQIDNREQQKSEATAKVNQIKKKLAEDTILLNKKMALLKKIQLRKRDAEGEFQSYLDEIKTSELKMQAAGLQPASYDALQKEIDSYKEKSSLVETKILEDMEKIELLEKDTNKSKLSIDKKTQQFEDLKFEVDNQITALNSEIDTLKTQRNQLSLKIDASLLELYEELRRKKGGKIIHMTDIESCPACGMGFAHGFVSSLASHDGAEKCPYCDLLIVWNGFRD